MDNFQVSDQPSQTLAKALLILEKFDSEKPDWGVRELAREMGENHGTVYRLLKTLQNAGYLAQKSGSKRYSLGPRVMKLANQYIRKNPLPSLALEVFKENSDNFEYNFYLGKLNNYEVIYLSVLDGRGPIKIVIDPGSTIVLHTTALGKVLLAFNSDQYIEEYLDTVGLDKFTKNSITDPKILWKQISTIRKQGYAINKGEHFKDVGAISVPIFQHNKSTEMGISLAYPQQFALSGQINPEQLVPLAKKIADEIENRSVFLDNSPLQNV